LDTTGNVSGQVESHGNMEFSARIGAVFFNSSLIDAIAIIAYRYK